MRKLVDIRHDSYDVYIGRKYGLNKNKHYGNPFSHLPSAKKAIKVESRTDAVTAYAKWLYGYEHQDVEPERRTWILNNLDQLQDKILGCFCWPKLCHGTILQALLEDKEPPSED